MPSRWDRLLETKPVPLVDHLLTEVARLLAQELRQWPLPVEEVEPAMAAALAPLLQPDARRPAEVVFREALQLVRWDLQREHEAYDDYFRNRRYLARGIAEADRPALLFISRWVLEQLLALGEATGGRVSRGALAMVAERVERTLATPPAEA